MKRAAKGRNLWALVLGLAAVLLAAALPAPAIAAAEAPSYAKTRVWGFEVQNPAGVGAERALSADGTRGYGESYDAMASGYPLVPRGTGLADDALQHLTSSQQRSIRSLEKRIAEHLRKLDDFQANPTVRPGMEGLPDEVIKAQQATRIRHLETEIRTFQNNIQKILNGEL